MPESLTTVARENDPEKNERHRQTVARVLWRLQELYSGSSTDTTDEERIMDGMNNQIIGSDTREALQALIEKRSRELEQTAAREGWDSDRLLAERLAMERKTTEQIFKEHWYESTLSTLDYPIHSATYGASMFRYDLRLLMRENPTPDSLDRYAWLRFDVNGLRSFKDCTSHEHTTRFLQAIAQHLVDPQGAIQRHFRALGISAIPMATGGDEFELYLRSRRPLTSRFLRGDVAFIQGVISSSGRLRSFLDYRDVKVIKKYGWPSEEKRQELARMEESEQRAAIRTVQITRLPECHVPSMAGGFALLRQGILRAVDKDERDLKGGDETFLTLRQKIAQGTIDEAEDWQVRNKEKEMSLLRGMDHRLHAWRLRTAESRRLAEQDREKTEMIGRLQGELTLTREALERVVQDNQDLATQKETVDRELAVLETRLLREHFL